MSNIASRGLNPRWIDQPGIGNTWMIGAAERDRRTIALLQWAPFGMHIFTGKKDSWITFLNYLFGESRIVWLRPGHTTRKQTVALTESDKVKGITRKRYYVELVAKLFFYYKSKEKSIELGYNTKYLKRKLY